MAGIAQTVDVRLLRRVIRFRKLVAGPLAMSEYTHDPVMLEEVLSVLDLRPGSTVVDGTLGLAGHAIEMIHTVQPMGVFVGFDWDLAMLERASQRIGEQKGVRVHLIHSDYRNALNLLLQLGLKADGFLLDLGLNSAQIDDPDRGISFRDNGPLDMRMNRSKGEPVSAAINRMSADEIAEILEEYGDERYAKRIAARIVERRKQAPLRTTHDLVSCVLEAIPVSAQDQKIHPATRVFQALRIYINGEIDGLEEAISDAAKSLSVGGKLVVLSYHSGEDRAAKSAFRELASTKQFEDLYKKPLLPSDEEIRRNPRSRSAKLRAIKRIS